MKRRVIAVAVLLSAAATSAKARDPQASALAASAVVAPTARPAAAVVDAFHAALRSGDLEAAAALLTDDVLIYEGGSAERSKAEYRAEHLPADAEFSKATVSTVTRRSGQATGSAAWISSEGQTSGEFRGRKVNSRTTETMVLVRLGGKWKISHIHWSSAAVR